MRVKIQRSSVVVLDLDDTLYPEIDFLKSGFRAVADFIVAQKHTDPYNEMLAIYKAGGNPFLSIIENCQYSFTVDELINIYRNHYPTITLSPGAEALLFNLKAAKCRMGLITDGRSISQRNKIKALNIEEVFDDIIISEEFGSEKPNRKNYQYFMNKYPNNRYYYIGDNSNKDFIAPVELGWTTVKVNNVEAIHKEFKSSAAYCEAAYCVDSLDEIHV